MSEILSLGHRVDRSEIYGPGVRSVFWTQGCNLGCKGCWNTKYWSKRGGIEVKISHLLEELDSIEGIEGITLLGGEPLQQAHASLQLIKGCKEKGLTVFLYTGYEPSEFDSTMQQCFDLSDIAVTGRFVQEQRDTSLQWRGSRNQQVHFISDAYDESMLSEQTEVECHILPNGQIRMVGYAEPELSSLLEVYYNV